MKLKASIMAIFAAALGMSLTSCVDPYYAGGPPPGPHGSGYRPGYEVRALPPGYRTEVIGGTRYYSHNNVYYQTRGGRYVVVDAPRRGPGPQGGYRPDHDRRSPGYDRQGPDVRRGPDYRGQGNVTVIRELPRGYQSVNHNGQRYYRSGNTYYQSRSNGYVVVRSPY